MKWGPALVCTFVVICIIFYQWPKIKEHQRKEKGAFIILSVFGWLLANLLIFFPDVPGPTELIDWLYKPLGNLLE